MLGYVTTMTLEPLTVNILISTQKLLLYHWLNKTDTSLCHVDLQYQKGLAPAWCQAEFDSRASQGCPCLKVSGLVESILWLLTDP